MNDDVRRVIYGTIVGFLAVVVGWVSFIYLNACGFTFTCNRGDLLVVRTPIPTLVPAGHGEMPMEAGMPEFNKCEVAAADLVGAWVDAEYPDTEAFPFTDVEGRPCEGTFAEDIQPLFVENSLWQPGAIGCVSCHNAGLTERSAGLDLTTYDAITANEAITGGGNWEASTLFTVLVNQGLVPEGHSAEQAPSRMILYAGEHVEATATPTP